MSLNKEIKGDKNMPFTMNNIVNIYEVFNNLSQANLPFKISYWVMRNLNIVDPEYQFFVEERGKLYDQYLVLNDKMSYVTPMEDGRMQFNLKDPDQAEEFINKFNELLDTDSDIQPYLISLDTLMDSNIDITPHQLDIISAFIDGAN